MCQQPVSSRRRRADLGFGEQGRRGRVGAGLATPEQAQHSVRFFMDPTWRAYGITYSAGEELCRAYVGDDPLRFRRLLTEHVRIGEL